MKSQMKRFVAMLLCMVLLLGLVIPQLPMVHAVDASKTVPQKHYSSYVNLAMVYDQNSCYSMQGMTVDNTYVYCAKTGSNDARATITRIDKNSGAKTLMTNSATGYSYFTNLSHANALDIVTVNGKENLFVTGGSTLVRLTVSGTKLTTAGTYKATLNGAAASMTAVQIMSASNTEVKVLVKSGRTLYTGTLNPAASSGTIALTKLCTLDITNVLMNGKMTDYSAFTQQGFDYHDGKVFLPLTGNAYVETINQSAVLVYDLEGATGNLRNDPSLSFHVTCTTYPGLFEMEDCAICPTTGKLYFASNRRKTASDTNHDGVSYFKNYVYDPSMSTTGADDYRWELKGNEFQSVTKGGNVFNEASLFHGNISNGTMNQAIYSLNRSVVLKHDQPWVVEWKSSGSFSGGSMLLATSRTRGVTNSPFLFRYQNSEFISIGYWNGSTHSNYGIRPGDYGIDGTKEHVYRLTNKIASNGSNMVYLSVDGKELGAMNNYYINATSQKTTSNWISGKDFAFSYMGSYGHPLNYCHLDYMQVWAKGLPEDQGNTYRWETANNLNTASGEGLTANAATLYRGSVTGTTYSDAAYRLQKAVKLMHDRPWSVEWRSAGVSGGTFLLAASDGSKTVNAPFLFRYGTNLIFLGNYDGSKHANYGIDLSDYGISGADRHTYCLTNKVAADGSNMVYLSVDGKELGAMNNFYNGINDQGSTSDWVSGKDFVFDYMGITPYTIKGTMDYVQVWEDGIPVVEDPTTATGTIGAYLDRVDSVSELKEGVPYVISDFNNNWKHYVLTSQYAEKVSSGKTHKGYLLSGTASTDTKDLWYIKDGYVVYGAAESNQYLLISYDASSQGIVELGNFNATHAARVEHYNADDFAIRGSRYLNRRGGTVNDVVATAYSSAGGSYWHLDRLVKEQTVRMTVRPQVNTLLAANSLTLPCQVTVDGIAAENSTVIWTSSNTTVATVSNGIVHGLQPGQVTVTATLTHANGKALEAPISVETVLTVEQNSVSVSGTVNAMAEKVITLKTGVPYVISEAFSDAILTGDMLYTTSAGYKGMSGAQGLMTVYSDDMNNVPVWYYDGTHLLYGSPVGTNNYLVYNSAGQVALGTKNEPNIYDKVVPYSTAQKTFNVYASNIGTRSYINQLGGHNFNVVGVYSSAYYSRWYFSQWKPAAQVTMTVTPGKAVMAAGEMLPITSTVKMDGTATANYALEWTSSNTSVAVVNSSGIITANGSGEAVITGKLTEVNGRALTKAVTVNIALQVTAGVGYTVTSVQKAQLTKVDRLVYGEPYVLTERFSGSALSGDMLYITDANYHGLSGAQGLELVNDFDINDAPVWYFDGKYLLYGSPIGSNNYLVYNSSNQVALGSINEPNIFDSIGRYDTYEKTFVMFASGNSSGGTRYYLNQYGGASYNVANLWYSAGSSQWHFNRWTPERTISVQVTPAVSRLIAGQKVQLDTSVTVNGTAVSDCELIWQTSDASVVSVNNGAVTAIGTGNATVTVTVTGADGSTFSEPVTVTIPLTVS